MTAKLVHHYRAFGLSILSPLPLPELDEAPSGSDIAIRFAALGPEKDARLNRECTYATEREACFFWEHAGRFLVRDGQEIIVDAAKDASDDAIRQYLLGPVLAMALHQRGFLVLHGSAVATASGAVVFLGGSGRGKSTTAAALHTRGRPTLADDIVAIDAGRFAEPRLIPGLPATNLWPDSAGLFGLTGEGVFDEGTQLKRAFQTNVFSETNAMGKEGAFAVESFYALDVTDAVACETLNPSVGVRDLFDHTFGPELLEFGLSGAIFAACADVARRVPVKRLSRTRSFDQLPEFIELIERDMAA